MKRVRNNDWVSVEFTGRLDSGEIVDTSRNLQDPVQFQVGAGELVEGFENAVIGMAPGELKNFRLEPENAYGIRDEEAQLTFAKSDIPNEYEEAKEGQIVMLQNDRGEQLPAQIVQVGPETVTVDLNHPLAGHPINFEVELIALLDNRE